mgnify:CR=1 FL=1
MSQESQLKHIAIIMDGNARWAKKNNLSLFNGHRKGVENIKNIAEGCIENNITHLTLYALSAENWKRPKIEIDNLLNLLDEYIGNSIKPLIENDVRINIFGDLSKIPQKTLDKIQKIQLDTANNKALNLNVAFGYGAKQEITRAVKNIAFDVRDKKIDPQDIDEELVSRNLYISDLPDPDLLIRTAGDLRVSNFLLWQIAYSELYFINDFWPDFNKKKLKLAIIDFNNRERRYGKRQ